MCGSVVWVVVLWVLSANVNMKKSNIAYTIAGFSIGIFFFAFGFVVATASNTKLGCI